MTTKATDELFNAIIKEEGINFRGVTIGDTLATVVVKEGNSFNDRRGTLPNYKYFFEIGEMEELILIYAYSEDSKTIYNLELTLKTYPKYYWQESGGTNEIEYFEQIQNNKGLGYLNHFTYCKDQIIAHFNNQFGASKIDNKHAVYNKPHQNFTKYIWVSEGLRLTLMSYLDDTKEPQSATTMELKLILTAE